MRRAAIFAAVLASLPVQAAAQQPAYRAVNWLIVVPLTPNSFEVLEEYGEGARGMWCAAGDYARNRIGVPVRAQLYLKGARGPSRAVPGRTAVLFTLDADTLDRPPRSSYSLSMREVGQKRSVAQSYQLCTEELFDIDDL